MDLEMIQKNKKIIDKIYKCLRLSESSNPNEAALALRQAASLMKKHGISDAQVMAAEINESATEAGERYNPPFWALALANLVANAFECRNLISRQYGKKPVFRFIGLGFRAEVATYSYTVLHRHLSRAIDDFQLTIKDNGAEVEDEARRIDIFAQAWLFIVGRTVSDFVGLKADKVVIDEYIEEKYGEPAELTAESLDTQSADYDDILSGLRAAHDVALYRSVGQYVGPPLLQHEQAP